jgi:hypothetical protein
MTASQKLPELNGGNALNLRKIICVFIAAMDLIRGILGD